MPQFDYGQGDLNSFLSQDPYPGGGSPYQLDYGDTGDTGDGGDQLTPEEKAKRKQENWDSLIGELDNFTKGIKGLSQLDAAGGKSQLLQQMFKDQQAQSRPMQVQDIAPDLISMILSQMGIPNF